MIASIAPPVSVIVPAYNAARFLGEALASIAAQHYPSLEVVLVDDGSDDSPEHVAAQAAVPVRVLRQARQGAAGARNAGVRACQGELIGFLDADDRLADGALAALVGHAVANPATDIVHGHLRKFAAFRPPDGGGTVERVGRPLLSFNVSSILCRRRVFDRIGLFDGRFGSHEDMELLLRARSAGLRRDVIDDVVLHYRRGHGGMSELPPGSPPRGPDLRPWFRILQHTIAARRRGDHSGRPS